MLKVDPDELRYLAEVQKQNTAELAAHFQVHSTTITRAIRRHKIRVAGDLTWRSAERVTSKAIDAMAALEKIYGIADSEIDTIRESMLDAKGEMRSLLREDLLKFTAEIRKQITLLKDIASQISHYQEFLRFKEAVLDAIGQADPTTRQKIVESLVRSRSLHSAVDITPTEVGN